MHIAILAPTGADAEASRAVLEQADLPARVTICANAEAVAGMAAPCLWVVAIESLIDGAVSDTLKRRLQRVGGYDFGVMLLVGKRSPPTGAEAARQRLGRPCNWLVLRRPLSRLRFLAEVRSCLEAAPMPPSVDEEQVAMLRHDLLAPLRQINLSLEMAAELGGPDSPQRNLISTSRHAVAGMVHLVRDGMRGGRPPVSHCSPCSVLDQVRAGMELELQAAQVRLEVGALPERWPMSAIALQRVLQNLISNAIRYRAERPLRIAIDGADGNEHLCLRVADNGMGIAPELAASLFEPYRTGAAAAARGGTGLGLAICRQLLERVRGRIWVESEPDVGSTFYLEVPACS